jgi:hypothetical protein
MWEMTLKSLIPITPELEHQNCAEGLQRDRRATPGVGNALSGERCLLGHRQRSLSDPVYKKKKKEDEITQPRRLYIRSDPQLKKGSGYWVFAQVKDQLGDQVKYHKVAITSGLQSLENTAST